MSPAKKIDECFVLSFPDKINFFRKKGYKTNLRNYRFLNRAIENANKAQKVKSQADKALCVGKMKINITVSKIFKILN